MADRASMIVPNRFHSMRDSPETSSESTPLTWTIVGFFAGAAIGLLAVWTMVAWFWGLRVAARASVWSALLGAMLGMILGAIGGVRRAASESNDVQPTPVPGTRAVLRTLLDAAAFIVGVCAAYPIHLWRGNEEELDEELVDRAEWTDDRPEREP